MNSKIAYITKLTTNDSILVKQLQKNSIEAFNTLYYRYSGRLYNFVLKISRGDVYRSEEIVQRVFIKIWENRDQINADQSFNTYLCTIAKNMLINELNHETVTYIYSKFILKEAETYYTEEEKIEFHFLNSYINQLIDELPPASREVYKLSRLKSYSNKEIATLLNKSESTVEKQIAKANEKIKEKIRLHFDKIFTCLLLLVFS